MPRFLLLAAIALAVLAACAPRPVPQAPPPPYPAEARARLLRILDGEWREWGGRVLDGRAGPVGEAGGGPVAEQDPAAFTKVLAYWSAVDWTAEIARNKRAFTLGEATACTRSELAAGGRSTVWGCQPWSAAFISFVLRATGIDAAEFPPAAAHWQYVDALILEGDRWGGRATFLGREPEEYAPAPGDLICADRSGGRAMLTDWRQRAADAGRFRPMHCDIVVSTGDGIIGAIGGNVRDAVTLTRFPADASGYLLPRAPGAGVSWFAVFENRLGCLPPWSTPGGPPCPPARPIDRSPES